MDHLGESRGPGRNLEEGSGMRVSGVGVSRERVVWCLLFTEVAKRSVRVSMCVYTRAKARDWCAPTK